MARDNAKPKVTGAGEKPRPETVVVEVEAEPESEADILKLGSKSLVTLKTDTEGDTVKVRILRACNVWSEGDEPTVNAEYGRQLIESGLAEPNPAKRAAPKGKVA